MNYKIRYLMSVLYDFKLTVLRNAPKFSHNEYESPFGNLLSFVLHWHKNAYIVFFSFLRMYQIVNIFPFKFQ